MEKHTVATFNSSGRLLYEAQFKSAEDAYREYVEIIENLKEHLPNGHSATVVRFVDNLVMAREKIVGKA